MNVMSWKCLLNQAACCPNIFDDAQIEHHNRWLRKQTRVREDAVSSRPRKREKKRCGAHARSTGKPVRLPR
jgi:hypothetical protein